MHWNVSLDLQGLYMFWTAGVTITWATKAE